MAAAAVAGSAISALIGPGAGVVAFFVIAIAPGLIALARADVAQAEAEEARAARSPQAQAVADFIATPLGALLTDFERRAARLRRRAGRASTIHPTLDAMVRAARSLKIAIAEDPRRADRLNAPLRRRLPLILDVAERRARLEITAKTDAERERIAAAQAALEQAAAGLTHLAETRGDDAAFLALEADAELLLERLAR